ncbi:ABC transporter transmembrane domain-containing protein [Salinihabitans flavidus]|uniref:ABC transporter transmembrane domain-containing protein n=1 Tax=Salinihabitans flavidus TaxID=569882 RepID=UPI000B88B49A|nr:ABC transporter transmembrane domain-containing protein [Salinihabitans flavidus]
MFSFIWKYSKRDQLLLLLLTAFLFPLLYLTLELPKRIINDAIGAGQSTVNVLGVEMSQVGFLVLLCFAFLASVLAHGLTKMRINTMKGILAERMLRRFRYTLISRILRFPQPYLQRTSQGELVSMVTAEAEPMGGMMGDAISQPVLQAGQMLTILGFLFAQSVWFGLASVALIPLQAWIIPRLQRQINRHNKERIREVRALAGEIGESAQGAATLRTHGGWRYRQAVITHRLGTLFDIRLVIYTKKFFMKFLNNFISQLTPFVFFLAGGYLVIQGNVSIGALVAALSAYKDLSAPWKELLTYYNQVQELSQRWELITERFAPAGMVDESLFEGEPEEIPHLRGDIELRDVSVRDSDGTTVLDDIDVTLQGGGMIAVTSPDEEDRHTLTALLTRELMPSSGKLVIAGHDLGTLHQRVIAARIGVAERRPYVFDGTLGENAMMALRAVPHGTAGIPEGEETDAAHRIHESERSGNSADPIYASWLSPAAAGLNDTEELLDWWLALMDAAGSGNELYSRGLDQCFSPDDHPELAKELVSLRPKVAEALREAGLDNCYHPFDPDRYNPALPVADNLFFATRRCNGAEQDLTAASGLLAVLRDTGLAPGMLKLSQEVIDMLNQTFGTDGTDHPLFQRLGLDPDTYRQSVDLVKKSRDSGLDALSDEEQALILSLPLEISAEQIGPAFTDEMKDLILELRQSRDGRLDPPMSEIFAPLSEDRFAEGLSVLENAVFGKLSSASSARTGQLREVVAGVLAEAGLRRQVAELLYAIHTGMGGAALPSVFAVPLALTRAAIKRPDILILDGLLSGHDTEARVSVCERLRELLPDTTLIVMEETLDVGGTFDQHIELEHGRIRDGEGVAEGEEDNAAAADLARKMRALSGTELFSGLPRKQVRLLAFGAKWFEAEEGDVIFRKGDAGTDGAYLILEGEAGIYLPVEDGPDKLITTAGPGKLVGELALIRKVPRALDMRAHTPLRALRLGESEFLAVVENDAATAYKILQVVAGYLG